MKNKNIVMVTSCLLFFLSIIFLTVVFGITNKQIDASHVSLFDVNGFQILSLNQQKAFAFHTETINKAMTTMQALIQGIQLNLNYTQQAIENKNTSQALTFLNVAQQQVSNLSNSTLLTEITTSVLQSIVSSPSPINTNTGYDGIDNSNYGSMSQFLHQNPPIPSPEPNPLLQNILPQSQLSNTITPQVITPQQSLSPSNMPNQDTSPQAPSPTTSTTITPQVITPQQSPTTSNPLFPTPVPNSPTSASPQMSVAPLSPTSKPPSSSLSPSTTTTLPPAQ
jgi:hypothetical protein